VSLGYVHDVFADVQMMVTVLSRRVRQMLSYHRLKVSTVSITFLVAAEFTAD